MPSRFNNQTIKTIIMTKQEFTAEIVLRLINDIYINTSDPAKSAVNLLNVAKCLADGIYGEAKTNSSRYWSDEVDAAPIGEVINCLYGSHGGRRYCDLLTSLFADNDITTVGDLLRLGRKGCNALKGVGNHCTYNIANALETLYGITAW